jgi:hypothetical protein
MIQLTKHTLRFFASTASVAASRAVGGSGAHSGRDEGKRGMLVFFIWRLQYSCIFSYCYLLLWFGYMVVSFEKSILFVLCFVNILLLIQVYDVLFQHLILAPSLLVLLFYQVCLKP